MDLHRTQSGLARWSEVVLAVAMLGVLLSSFFAIADLREPGDGKHPEVVISYGDDDADSGQEPG
ncbi:MAG TPA: hypothetical protein VM509_13595 [Planctomycetota bacterium]|nr:hypothetical protein [Planctomycetota bacterium]